MREGERGDDGEEAAHGPERDEAAQEQQVIDAAQDVLDPQRREAAGGVIPGGVERHATGPGGDRERPTASAERRVPDAHLGEVLQVGSYRRLDREDRSGRGDRVRELSVEVALVVVDTRGRVLGLRDVRDRPTAIFEGAIGWQREAADRAGAAPDQGARRGSEIFAPGPTRYLPNPSAPPVGNTTSTSSLSGAPATRSGADSTLAVRSPSPALSGSLTKSLFLSTYDTSRRSRVTAQSTTASDRSVVRLLSSGAPRFVMARFSSNRGATARDVPRPSAPSSGPEADTAASTSVST